VNRKDPVLNGSLWIGQLASDPSVGNTAPARPEKT